MACAHPNRRPEHRRALAASMDIENEREFSLRSGNVLAFRERLRGNLVLRCLRLFGEEKVDAESRTLLLAMFGHGLLKIHQHTETWLQTTPVPFTKQRIAGDEFHCARPIFAVPSHPNQVVHIGRHCASISSPLLSLNLDEIKTQSSRKKKRFKFRNEDVVKYKIWYYQSKKRLITIIQNAQDG